MKAAILAIMAGLCWGIGEIFTKQVLHTGRIGPLTAIAVRTTVALPVLWLVWWIFVYRLGMEPRRWFEADTPTLLRLLLGSGLVAGALAMIFFYYALHLGEASRVKPLAFTVAPAMGVLLGWLVLAESMSARKLAAVCLILIGVLLMLGE